MSLLLAGIDEAGYGPTLGPLTVGLSLFRVRAFEAGDGAPDLWKLLSRGVCREPGRGGKPDRKGRVAIADSKQLKLANSVSTTHPLVHLERGVLTFLGALSRGVGDDATLLESIGASLPTCRCYSGEPISLPLAHGIDELGIAESIVAGALKSAGVDIIDLRCRVMAEAEFNGVVRSTGSKAEATSAALVEHLRCVWDAFTREAPDTRLGIVCDRQGGRMSYSDLLSRAYPGATIHVVEQTEHRSRYTIELDGRSAGVGFLTEGESAHLPVALASMVAKYVRELAMMRFNRHWASVFHESRGIELRPTAGYAQDARRWLDEMKGVLTLSDREQIVRIA